MGLFSTIRRTVRAHWAPLRDGTPEEAVERLLTDAEERLAEARAELTACTAEGRRLLSLRAEEVRLAMRMRARAARALQAGDEVLAREAMQRSLHALRQGEQYGKLYQAQQEGGIRLERLVTALEGWRADLEVRRHALAIRRRVAQARRSAMRSLHGSAGRWGLQRAEEETITDEFAADAYEELVGEKLNSDLAALDTPSGSTAVDTALQQLRTELALPEARNPEKHGNHEA